MSVPNPFARLKAAGCRTDGVNVDRDGSVVFRTTNAGGAWTDAEKNAVLGALGRAAPVLTAAQRQVACAAAIQAWMDGIAKQYGYNNLAYAASYDGSSVDLWNRQGAAFKSWRDQVWQSAFAILAAMQAGTQPMPACDAALIAALPQPSIPKS